MRARATEHLTVEERAVLTTRVGRSGLGFRPDR